MTLAKDAAGEKVAVVMVEAGARPQQQQQQGGTGGREGGGGGGERDRDRERGGGGDRERERRRRSRSRSRDRDGREREGGRGRDPERDRRRSRSRSRDRYERRRSRSGDRRPDGRGAAAAPPAPADPVAAAASAAAAAGKSGWLLVIGVSKPEGRVGELVLGPLGPNQRVVFGRAPPPACDVTLEHPSISRQHAALSADGRGGAVLTDLGSAHGTKLGDVWLKPQGQKGFAVGAAVRFGASTRAYTLERVERVG